jgi:uncharacterized membrane protein YkvA (DUF1232 family)
MRSWLAVLGTLVTRLRLTGRLLRDPAVPIPAKALPLAAVLYLIFPVDFVPDLIPVLGQLDDLGVILLALEAFVHLSPPEPVRFHQAALAQGTRYQPMPRARVDTPGQVIDAEFREDDNQRR